MKTRNTKLGVIAITLLSAAMPFTAKAQDKVKSIRRRRHRKRLHLARTRRGRCKPSTQRIHRL